MNRVFCYGVAVMVHPAVAIEAPRGGDESTGAVAPDVSYAAYQAVAPAPKSVQVVGSAVQFSRFWLKEVAPVRIHGWKKG